MVKKLFYFILFLVSFPCYGNELNIISFKKAEKQQNKDINASFWEQEIKSIKDKNINFYFSETDLSLLGNKDYISFIESPELCGANFCPLKIVSNGKVIFKTYAPLTQNSIITEPLVRGFFPNFTINNNIFTYYYDTNQYKNTKSLIKNANFIQENNCIKCLKENIPTNLLTEKMFDSFAQEIEYEAQIFKSPHDLGLYGLSRMALARIGLVEKDSIMDTQSEFKWTKSANKLGIKENSDFLKNEVLQKNILKKYISFLHKKLLPLDTNIYFCEQKTDIYKRTSNTDFWGLLKGIYMMGNSTFHKNPTIYDGTDKNKYIIDGIALSNNCIKKIITGFIVNKNMIVLPENSFIKGKRGTIE